MIKYATAIRTASASTEAILRRFTRNASHPTYAAMLEVGRAQKTIFVARYLRLRDLQREIEEGLNVVESYNGANGVLAYGKRGDIQTNRRDEQELFVLSLRILQAALVYINTLMLQEILDEPAWGQLLTAADRRGLTPLFWELYPEVVDGPEEVGGVPSRLLKTDAGDGRQEGTPWRMFAGSPSGRTARSRSRWTTSLEKVLGA